MNISFIFACYIQDLKDGLFPAIYNKHTVESIVGKKVPLDHNHTHFILVDDGTESKFGGEIEFRSKLEGYISQQECDIGDENDCKYYIPITNTVCWYKTLYQVEPVV